jgi:hypothetical protein
MGDLSWTNVSVASSQQKRGRAEFDFAQTSGADLGAGRDLRAVFNLAESDRISLYLFVLTHSLTVNWLPVIVDPSGWILLRCFRCEAFRLTTFTPNPDPPTPARAERRTRRIVSGFGNLNTGHGHALGDLDRHRTNRHRQECRENRLFRSFKIRLGPARAIRVELRTILIAVSTLSEASILIAVAVAIPVAIIVLGTIASAAAIIRLPLMRMTFLALPFRHAILPFTSIGAFGVFARAGIGLIRVLLPRLLALLHGPEGEAIRSSIEIVLVVILVRGTVLLRQLRLMRGRDEAIIMFRVLEIALRHHRITRYMGIPRQLCVFFGDMLGGSANFYIGTIRFIAPRQRVRATTIAATHALVLSWSHWFLSCHKPDIPVLPRPRGDRPWNIPRRSSSLATGLHNLFSG